MMRTKHNFGTWGSSDRISLLILLELDARIFVDLLNDNISYTCQPCGPVWWSCASLV